MYISEEEVYPIPIPKNYVHKAIPELANQSVLDVELFYETRDRKPWKLLRVGFSRIKLDEKGQYTLTLDEAIEELFNYQNFDLATVEELSQRETLPIPRAIVLPNSKEKSALINYIKQKYPALWKNSPEVLEMSIISLQKSYSKYVNMFKSASSIK